MNNNPPVDPSSTVPVPEYYPPTYPNEPETIDLTDTIEPGEPGYRDPDSARLSGILMKIDRLISMVDSTVAGAAA